MRPNKRSGSVVAEDPPRGIPQAGGGAARVLLIEDHVDTASAMRRLLELEGYQVTIAYTRAAALEAASHDRFDVLITDLNLPDGNGAEVVSLVRHLSGPCPAIAVSGTARVDLAVSAMQMGFNDYLIKPIRIEDLRRSLASAVATASRPPLPPSLPPSAS